MKTYGLDEIKDALAEYDPFSSMEEGFSEYSNGNVVIPPVGEMIFEKARGEVHIKYGYIKGNEYYVIKIASGFYGNEQRNLPPTPGLLIVASQTTGAIKAILDDAGYLTNVRTAAAGAIAAKHLMPKNVHGIGILGAGTQARMQAIYLKKFVNCDKLFIWNRTAMKAQACRDELQARGFNVVACDSPADVAAKSNLIVTCTAAKSALLSASDIRRGTHITAIGSDTVEKTEIDPTIVATADVVVVDSLEQCRQRGEVFQALRAGIRPKRLVELGEVITKRKAGRTSEDQVTLADLTGLAIQDIQIAKAVLHAMAKQKP